MEQICWHSTLNPPFHYYFLHLIQWERSLIRATRLGGLRARWILLLVFLPSIIVQRLLSCGALGSIWLILRAWRLRWHRYMVRTLPAHYESWLLNCLLRIPLISRIALRNCPLRLLRLICSLQWLILVERTVHIKVAVTNQDLTVVALLDWHLVISRE